MNGNPYRRIPGTGVTTMLGRDALYTELCRRLDRPEPENVSLVGPRYFGKSVMLRRLATDYENGKNVNAEFVGAFYWDLSAQPPTSDLGFLRRLCELTKNVLTRRGIDEAGLIDATGDDFDGMLESLKYVLAELQRRDSWILGAIDGVERPLTEEALTRNLWGNLRFLASESALRLVTGSKSPLSEVCMTEGARDSHFHLIFDAAPIVVGKFLDADLPALFAPLAAKVAAIDASAHRELMQCTGGVPLLVATVLGHVFDHSAAGETIRQQQITEAADEIGNSRKDVLGMLWNDCDPEMQSDLVAMQSRQLRREEVSAARQDDHETRGYAGISGGDVKLRSRMMGVFARRQNSGLSQVKQVFGDEERYRENIRSFLEVRRDQVARKNMAVLDSDLFNLVQNAVTHVRDPMTATIFARRIRNRALHLIWNTELPGGQIPAHWLAALHHGWTAVIPAPSGNAIRLLQMATGTQDIPKLTTRISKRTYTLLSFMHSVGDHAEHADPPEVTWSYTAAFGLAAIELLESISLDLTPPPGAAPTSAAGS